MYGFRAVSYTHLDVYKRQALDYDAEQYRVLTYVDGVPYSAQFRFESVEQGLEEALEE